MKTAVALGDSQTQPWQWGNLPFRAWAPLLDAALGRFWQVRCLALGGNTTANLLARTGAAFRWETPDLAIIYIGVNDPGASITQATTQLNIEGIVMALKHGASGNEADYNIAVAGQANLPDTGLPGQRYVVLNDSSTTGGKVARRGGDAPTITGSAAGPTVWEYRLPRVGELGWGRVAVRATAPTAVKRIVVVTANYQNWTTGGDTLTTPYAAYVPVRAAQAAAVAAQNVNAAGVPSVVLADLYAFQKARIQNGEDPDFSATGYDQAQSWHAIQNNQHHNDYGHELVEACVEARIAASWPSEFTFS